MRKALSCLIACGLLLLAGCARAEPQPKGIIHARPALWVVRDKDTTIYLFGTVHVLRPGIHWFEGPVKAAFDRSQTLVLEMVEPPPAQMASLVTRMAYNPNGPTVSERLAPADRARFEAAATEAGVPLAALERFDPWMAAVTLSIAPLQKMGFDSKSGAEDVLNLAAHQRRMTIEGLETAEQQLGYFDSMAMPLQIAYLNATIAEMPDMESSFTKLIDSWSRGQTDAIAAEMNESLEKTPELADLLLFQRNERWAQWIAQRMKQPGVVFIAVGAGHLAGKGSVLDALAQHKLRAVRLTKPVATKH